MNISLASESELAEVEAFYSTVGYTGGALPADLIFVARDGSRIIGVVRLCEESGCCVLRGMYVASERQRSGIGTALLSELNAKVGARECWCIPFTHLREFYGVIGFGEVAPSSAPQFLRERHARYLNDGGDMIVMVRASNQSKRHSMIEST